ncbi:glucose 1-dehydrogenase [Nakamurella sp. YIM 132087]|uniref:Glucose 1-dehydrogenase n=1 Tax=Nakamurella alba TaxID=2665158 RepID=A0A7K1FSX8_9ACTN|nr:SDR family oxidoreductase [Nakamurella alba]MTD17262.1 glucose 1-dehydrogenase [Nakamurella alba]
MDRPLLDGKVALITGGSRGIGFGIATAFRAEGATVVLTARKAAGLDEAREQLLATPGTGQVHTVVANAGDPDQAAAAVAETAERFGPLDVLVNNAATNPYMGPLADIDLSRAAKTAQVNQIAPMLWIHAAREHGMGRDSGAAVINVASVGGLLVDPHIGFYNATKAALIHLTMQLGYELGPDIRVNAIAPGVIKTELARAVWEAREGVLTAQLPMRRLGTVEDCGNAAVFLASDLSSWITGHTLVIDGGALGLPRAVQT